MIHCRQITRIVVLLSICFLMTAGGAGTVSAADSNLAITGVFTQGGFDAGRFTNVPLGDSIKVQFNQPVVINAGNQNPADGFVSLTTVVVRDDGTYQQSREPVAVPSTLSEDKKNLSLSLQGVQLADYVKGGQTYCIKIPKTFIQAQSSGRRAASYSFYLATRSDLQVVDVKPATGSDGGTTTITFNDVVQRNPVAESSAANAVRGANGLSYLLGLPPVDPVGLTLFLLPRPPVYILQDAVEGNTADNTPNDDDSDNSAQPPGGPPKDSSHLWPQDWNDYNYSDEELESMAHWYDNARDRIPPESEMWRTLKPHLLNVSNAAEQHG